MVSLNLNKIEVKFNNIKFYNKTNSNIIKNNFVQDIEPIDYSIDPTTKNDTIVKYKTVKPFMKDSKVTVGSAVVCGAISSAILSSQHINNQNFNSSTGSIAGSLVAAWTKIKYSTDFADYAESFVGGKQNPLNAHTNWCLMFVNYCIKSNGSFESIDGFNLDEVSCSAQVKYINENNPDSFHLIPANYNNIKESNYIPKKGDIFFIENEDSDRDSYVVRHVGIVDDVIKDEYGNVVSITTIEGNMDGSSYMSSVVSKESYVVDDKGRFCFQSGNYVNNNCVIYGFFDTASSINTNN